MNYNDESLISYWGLTNVAAVEEAMKHWQTWNLKTKLVISFTVLFAFSFILTGVFYYYSSVKELEKQSLQLLSTNSTQITRSLELYTEDLEKLSLSVFNDSIVQKMVGMDQELSAADQAELAQQVTAHLMNMTISWPDVQGIYLYTERKLALTYFWSKRSPPIGHTIEQEPWYPLEMSKRSTFLLWPTMRENTITNFLGEQVFSLIRPINHISTGKHIGYMKIDIHADVFKDLVSFQENKNVSNSMLFVVTDDGQVVYDIQDTLTGKSLPGIQMSDLPRYSDMGTINWEGKPFLYGLDRSNYTKWTTLILTPMDSITKQLNHIRNTVVWIEIGMLFLVVVVGWLIATGITKPLRKMIITMRHVERGDFTVRLDNQGTRNEIGLLGKVFNQMLDSLQDMIAKVYVAEIREKEARLIALQAQINPHFLFNTLTILKSLGRKGASEDVVEVTESLAHLFRYSLYDWNRTVELTEELNLVESYIKIQKYRFRDRFAFEKDIPEELYKVQVLRLMIQPLVENAVVHGLENRRSGGLITVSVRKLGEILEIIVSDNGAGMRATVQEKLKKRFEEAHVHGPNTDEEHLGIALVNIQKRLQLLYGTEYGLTCVNVESGGTAMILRLPLIWYGEEESDEHHAD
ncbi:sensor histidine kinase [Paenibacillus luteus]|uniref:sensor histidine kinase n=1 Tax=Paenibacillus luteus TaxID=2545753 RepID=UPI00137573CD|nr:sensor histidine kinase [Paenibacillus luteus]